MYSLHDSKFLAYRLPLCIAFVPQDGMTPLLQACVFGQTDIVKVLLQYNADSNKVSCSLTVTILY